MSTLASYFFGSPRTPKIKEQAWVEVRSNDSVTKLKEDNDAAKAIINTILSPSTPNRNENSTKNSLPDKDTPSIQTNTPSTARKSQITSSNLHWTPSKLASLVDNNNAYLAGLDERLAEPKTNSNKSEQKKDSDSMILENDKPHVDTPFKPNLKRKEPPSATPVTSNSVNSKRRRPLYFLPMKQLCQVNKKTLQYQTVFDDEREFKNISELSKSEKKESYVEAVIDQLSYYRELIETLKVFFLPHGREALIACAEDENSNSDVRAACTSLIRQWDNLRNFRPRSNSFKAPLNSTPIQPSKDGDVIMVNEAEKDTNGKRSANPEVEESEGPSTKKQKKEVGDDVSNSEEVNNFDPQAYNAYAAQAAQAALNFESPFKSALKSNNQFKAPYAKNTASSTTKPTSARDKLEIDQISLLPPVPVKKPKFVQTDDPEYVIPPKKIDTIPNDKPAISFGDTLIKPTGFTPPLPVSTESKPIGGFSFTAATAATTATTVSASESSTDKKPTIGFSFTGATTATTATTAATAATASTTESSTTLPQTNFTDFASPNSTVAPPTEATQSILSSLAKVSTPTSFSFGVSSPALAATTSTATTSSTTTTTSTATATSTATTASTTTAGIFPSFNTSSSTSTSSGTATTTTAGIFPSFITNSSSTSTSSGTAASGVFASSNSTTSTNTTTPTFTFGTTATTSSTQTASSIFPQFGDQKKDPSNNSNFGSSTTQLTATAKSANSPFPSFTAKPSGTDGMDTGFDSKSVFPNVTSTTTNNSTSLFNFTASTPKASASSGIFSSFTPNSNTTGQNQGSGGPVFPSFASATTSNSSVFEVNKPNTSNSSLFGGNTNPSPFGHSTTSSNQPFTLGNTNPSPFGSSTNNSNQSFGGGNNPSPGLFSSSANNSNQSFGGGNNPSPSLFSSSANNSNQSFGGGNNPSPVLFSSSANNSNQPFGGGSNNNTSSFNFPPVNSGNTNTPGNTNNFAFNQSGITQNTSNVGGDSLGLFTQQKPTTGSQGDRKKVFAKKTAGRAGR